MKPVFVDPLNLLFDRIKNEVPGLFADKAAFDELVSQTYDQPNRFFHGPAHLIEMTDQISGWVTGSYNELADKVSRAYDKPVTADEMAELKRINLVAALGHDTEYHVDGKWTEDGRAILAQYAKANDAGLPTDLRADIAADDRVAHIVLDLFGMKPGDKLSPFTGQNEVLSALVLAKKLEAAGADIELIVGAATSIEATVPFKKQEDFGKIQGRLDALYAKDAELSARYPDETSRRRRADMLAGAGTLLANQDVLGFMGGLESKLTADTQGPAAATVESVRKMMVGGDLLVTEEGPKALQVAKSTGDYKPYDMLAPTFKRARLNDLVLGEKTEKLYHGIKLRGIDEAHVQEFPPVDMVERMNRTVRNGTEGAGDIANLAYKARVAALAFTHATALAGDTPDAKLRDLAEVTPMVLTLLGKRADMTVPESIAVEALAKRDHGLPNDISRSPIASALIQAVGSGKINELYKAAEANFGKAPGDKAQAQKFIDDAGAIIGAVPVNTLTKGMKASLAAATGQPSHSQDLDLDGNIGIA